MQSQSFPVLSPLVEQQPPVESLNQLMDPISFLTETEMQQDLDFFANTQFSYDVPPASVVLNDHCWNNNNNHGSNGNPYCYDATTPGSTSGNGGNYSNASGLSSPTATTPSSGTFGEDDDEQYQEKMTHPPHPAGPPQQQQPKLSKDDKRKRNTAASARFRVKKKLREQALQRTAYEMTEKSKRLEAHIHDLEREIKWLKALVVEKSEGRLEQLVSERPMPTVQYSPCAYQPPSSLLQDDDNENDIY